MKNKKLIVYGIGSYAEYVAYAFDHDSEYEVVCFCIEERLKTANEIFGKPLESFENIEELYNPQLHSMFIAIGNNEFRTRLYKQIKKEFALASYISSQARTSKNLISGENCFIDEGCIIQPFVKIGDNCILFAADVAHHTKIESHCLISGAITGGNVVIGEFSYLGMKSAIKQNIKVGEHNVIGMGCNIEKDTSPYAVYSNKGTTERKITSDRLGNRFLR